MAARKPILLTLGVILFALGAFVAVRPLWIKTPLTGARWLDMMFALVFMLRGAMNVRAARRARP